MHSRYQPNNSHVEDKDKTRAQTDHRWNHITTQPGPRTLCRVWENGQLIADFSGGTESLTGLQTQRGVLDLQPAQREQRQMQIFLKGGVGPTQCATVDLNRTIDQLAEQFLPGNISMCKVHVGARSLAMHMTISQAEIRHHDVLHFTTRSRGGGKHPKDSRPDRSKQKIKKKTPNQLPPLTL